MLSAMRHFAAELEAGGVEVDLRRADSFAAGIEAHRARHAPDEVVVLLPHNLRARERLAALDGVTVRDETLFLTHPQEFAGWAEGRRRLVMEDFYRWQRRRLGVLLDDGGEPAGGAWNFDEQNREPPPRDRRPPGPSQPREDEIDAAVRRDLDALGLETFGRDRPRRWPATRAEAEALLQRFVEPSWPTSAPGRTRCSTASAGYGTPSCPRRSTST